MWFSSRITNEAETRIDFCRCLCLRCHSSIHDSVPAQGTGYTLPLHTLVLRRYSKPNQLASPSIFSSHFPSVPLLLTACSNNPSSVFTYCQQLPFDPRSNLFSVIVSTSMIIAVAIFSETPSCYVVEILITIRSNP